MSIIEKELKIMLDALIIVPLRYSYWVVLEASQIGKARCFCERKHARGKRELEGRESHVHAE
jgi:hypothetical protein